MTTLNTGSGTKLNAFCRIFLLIANRLAGDVSEMTGEDDKKYI